MRVIRKIRSRCAEDRGESLAEFAISAIAVLMIMLGIMDCARCLYTYHFISYAAQEGTRYAIVRGSTWNGASCTSAATQVVQDCTAVSADVQKYVRGMAPPGVTASNVTVNTTWPQTTVSCTSSPCSACSTENAPGCMVKITVGYSFNFMVPFLPTGALQFTSTSEQIIQE